VIYLYRGEAEDPDESGYAATGYDLLSVFAEMWERRDDCCGSGHMLDSFGSYSGHRFSAADLGRKFDGNDGSDDAASTPWNWSDNDDAPWRNGDWFMDPAGYQRWQFTWAEPFADGYQLHPFLTGDLPDEIYNGRGGTTALRLGPYRLLRMVTVMQGQTLVVRPGRLVRALAGTGLHAEGSARIEGGVSATRVVDANDGGLRVVEGGAVLFHPGGAIRFP
jgi:hypothetical protein